MGGSHEEDDRGQASEDAAEAVLPMRGSAMGGRIVPTVRAILRHLEVTRGQYGATE
jgi:hypothetical protein